MTADTYRVIVTNFDGSQVPLDPQTRDDALAYFGQLLAAGVDEPWVGKDRLRVMSDHEWRKVRPLGGA